MLTRWEPTCLLFRWSYLESKDSILQYCSMDKHWNSMSINKLISILLRQDTETLIMQIENIPKTAVDDLPLKP